MNQRIRYLWLNGIFYSKERTICWSSPRNSTPPLARAIISLDYDSRKRGRLKTLTETEEEAGLFLDRGQTLKDGDYLRATDGRWPK